MKAIRLPLKWRIILIFVAALLPRLYSLGTFLTIDEAKWADGAAQFLLALRSGDLAQTYWHFHPGITITWGSALVLGALCVPAADFSACTHARVANLAETIGWLRLSPVLLTSLGIAAVYGVGRRLWGDRLAGLTALLLAFDPFFVAHARILNGDAGAAIFMFLAVTAFLIFGLEETRFQAKFPLLPRPLWLLVSGVMAGLALLTKLPAPLIGVFVPGLGLAALTWQWRQKRAWFWLAALTIWGGTALGVFVALWPAMWVAPVATLRQMVVDAFEVGGAGEGHAAFFMGQTVTDPGPWFYPYVIALRLTPVVMVGLLGAVGWLGMKLVSYIRALTLRARAEDKRRFITALVMLVFVIFIILFANVSPKKLDRYVMAVIPALIFLSALGLMQIGAWLKAGLAGQSFSAVWPRLWVTAAVMLQLLFAVLAWPYYLTYYNPLLGGVRQAAAQTPVGWGEGLEQAAFYLNSLPNAELLTVSSWYSDIFQPYFVGQLTSFSDDGRSQLAADYVVFYVNQIQRQKPYPGLVNYFRAQRPVFVVAVKPTGQVVNLVNPTVDDDQTYWVEVYPAPAAQSAGGAPKIKGVAQLLAYKVAGSRVTGNKVTDNAAALSPDEVAVTLFLRVLGPLPPGATFGADLTNGQQWGQWTTTEVKGDWQEDALVEWRGVLTLPADMPPGDYRLWAALQSPEGTVLSEFSISEKDPLLVP